MSSKDDPIKKDSIQLSWLLRHGAAEEGLEVDAAGWVQNLRYSDTFDGLPSGSDESWPTTTSSALNNTKDASEPHKVTQARCRLHDLQPVSLGYTRRL